MTALSLTYTLTNGTTADADQVQQNFVDLRDYVNNSVVRTDGTNAMTAGLSLSGSPTAAAHATRRAYTDGAIATATGGVAQTWPQDTWQTVKFATEVRDGTDGANASTNLVHGTGVFTVPVTGVYLLAGNFLDGLVNSTALWESRFLAGGTAYSGPSVEPSLSHPFVDPLLPICLPLYLTAAQTVEAQLKTNASSNPSKTVGKWLSITWLHG